MNGSIKKIEDLWKLSPEEFNSWRRSNDLPQLLNYFNRKLPKFSEWFSTFSIDNNIFLNAPHTGQWFLGEEENLFIEYFDNGKQNFVITRSFKEDFSFRSKHRKIEIVNQLKFIPYIYWAKNKIGKVKFIKIGNNSSQYTDTFKYNNWDETNNFSKARLLSDHIVLKLGQIKLSNEIICGRNLDFVDLDKIIFSDGFPQTGNGSESKAVINFSSCRNWIFDSADGHYFQVSSSTVMFLKCYDSRVSFDFKNCDVWSPVFKNCDVTTLNFDNTMVLSPTIEKTELTYFSYTPSPKPRPWVAHKDNYRIFRFAFQSIGKIYEAKKYYYLEKCSEREELFYHYKIHENLFPKKRSKASFKEAWEDWKNSKLTNNAIFKYLIDNVIFFLKVWVVPQYFLRNLKFKYKYFVSWFEWVLWGYGEKPIRIIFVALFGVFSYSIIYFFYGPQETLGSLTNSIYFSVVTFTTLGYGDILPTYPLQKALCCSEAFLGALLLGLIIAGYSNRSRY